MEMPAPPDSMSGAADKSVNKEFRGEELQSIS